MLQLVFLPSKKLSKECRSMKRWYVDFSPNSSRYICLVLFISHGITSSMMLRLKGQQLTFTGNGAVKCSDPACTSLIFPDENYGRENLQLHTIGLIMLHENGTAKLDRFGQEIATYVQDNIFGKLLFATLISS